MVDELITAKYPLLRGYPSLMPVYASLPKPRRSSLELLISAFNVKNFVLKLSWSIASHFVTIHC